MTANPAADRLAGVGRVSLFALLLLTPLPFGSAQAGSVLCLQVWAGLLGALALAAVWRSQASFPPLTKCLVIGAASVLIVGVVQLMPAPPSWIRVVATPTAEARGLVGAVLPDAYQGWMPVSLEAPATVDAILRFTAYALVGLAALTSIRTNRHLRQIAVVFAISGAFQGFYGAAEYLSGHQHIFGYAKEHMLDSATGTFINRNHYAAYLAMTLPFALGLAIDGTRKLPAAPLLRQRVTSLATPPGLQAAGGLSAAALIWLGILLSYSRSGFASAIVAVLLLVAGAGRRSSKMVLLWVVLLIPSSVMVWQEVGVPGERFVADAEGLQDLSGRLPVWGATAGAIGDYAILGSGLGTFAAVFPLYRPPAVAKLWEHLHNDWLQMMLEGGLALWVVLALGIALVCRRRPRLIESCFGTGRDRRVFGASIAVIALLAFVDFGLRIPSIAVSAAVIASMAGALFVAWLNGPKPLHQ
jgi:hypothetical protein